ncbi:MAG: ferritin [Bacteroidia bacterium]|nr:ferritin [Bacteroidia bacterium]
MLSEKLCAAFNAQINAELWSAYLYLSMSVNASAQGQKGAANWYMVQFQEEQAHAQILMNHVLSRGSKVTLAPIAEVQTQWANTLESFKDTLAHEKKVTALINGLYEVALEEKDYAAQNLLRWFIDEQVEEEESANEIIEQLEAVDGNKYGILMIDKDLATRTYTAPALLQKGE